jgi:hypothetical protein
LRVATLIKTSLAIIGGLALGLYATSWSLEKNISFGDVRAGAWTGLISAGTRDADPYARALFAKRAETPIGITEGLSFLAKVDQAGEALRPSCDYIVKGNIPAARYWTLSLLGEDGRVLPASSARYGFTSAEILRNSDGSFEIIIAPEARAGNWLQSLPQQNFQLMLRLYDTSLSASAYSVTAQSMPRIERGRCA